MKRVIKFRGQRKINGVWTYGSLVSIGEDWDQIIPLETEYDDLQHEMIRVMTHSIGQFTGLTDKNGVDIYEGDMFSKVSIDELGNNIDYFYTVKWSSSNQGFRCYRYRLDENENGLYWRKQPSDESLVMVVMYNHVIGNIHQNPELL